MTEQEPPAFEFIDLFAGIGGLRIGLESIGGECVFSSEWDKFAQQTYEAWHGERPAGDITAIDPASVPDHDILAAGFPCQPFSIAGVSKKISLGRAHGFADHTGSGAASVREVDATVHSSAELLEKFQGKTADAPMCMTCGTKMRPAGSCYVCEGCGSTSGCS